MEKPEKIRGRTALKWTTFLICVIGFLLVQVMGSTLYQWNDDIAELRRYRGFSYVFLLAAVAVLHIRTREGYVQSFGMTPESVHRDLLESLHRRFWWKILILLGILFFFFQSDYRFGGVPLFGWICMAGGLLGCVNYVLDLLSVKKGDYRILEDRVTGKRKDTDSDGVHHFVVVYSNELHSWEKKVSGSEYLNVHLGDSYTAVYLKRKRKPEMKYPVISVDAE